MAEAFHRQIAAEEMAVRAALAEVRGWLTRAALGEDLCGTVEIALAEALNNVVEHAYGDARGTIVLTMQRAGNGLRVILRDQGTPLPDLHPPAGTPPPVTGERATLPEGGFGWFLIRTLARDLHYAHEAGENRLTLVFDLENRADPAP